MRKTSALTRVRRRNSRALLAAAITIARESLRTALNRSSSERNRERLRRALCDIAERLGCSEVEVEPMLAQVRCGHQRGRWTREFTPIALTAVVAADPQARRERAR